ncbi:MAG: PAS domain S-box protein [Chloroflexi bacterium]|nr:PAS domain S-box protein [Chloroflexota bacterium]
MSYAVYMIALSGIVSFAGGGAVYAWRHRTTPGARSLAGLMLMIAAWAMCDILAAISPSPEMARLFESKLRFGTIATSSVLILLLPLEYSGRQEWLRPWRLLLLSVVPLLTQAIIWLGPPDAFLISATYARRDGFYVLTAREFGPWFAVHALYGYALILVGFVLLLLTAVRSRFPYRGQAFLLFLGLVVMAAISLVRTLGSGLLLEYDWIVIAFAVTGTIWLVALFRYRLFDLAPIARTTLIENMDDMVLVLDPQNRIVDFNTAAGRNLNWTPPAIIGQPLAAVLPDWARVLDRPQPATAASPAEVQLGERVFDLRPSPLHDNRRQALGCLLVLRDITARKQAEQAVRQNEAETLGFLARLVALHEITMELAQVDSLLELYRRAVALAHDRLGFDRIGLFLLDENDPEQMIGAFGIDPQGQVRDERSTQHPITENDHIREALVNKVRFQVWKNVPLWDQREVVGHGWNAMATLWDGTEGIGWLVADNLLTGKPPSTYTLELMALYGTTLGYLITNLRNQIARRESEARFRMLSEATFEGILIHDQGTIVDTNPAFAAMAGYSQTELTGMQVLDFVAEESHAIITDETAVGTERVFEAVGQRRDGTTFPAEVRVRSVPYQGRMMRVATVRDMTQQRQAEQQRVQLALEKRRVQLLTDFITNATHEFRTPLSVIDTRTYLLQKTTEEEQLHSYAADISEQVHNLSGLVDDLIVMSRLDSDARLDHKPLNVNMLVEWLSVNLSERLAAENLTLELDLAPTLPPVLGDANRLSAAFGKIVDNARRYTPPGGTITIQTRQGVGCVLVSIRDTGIGMTDEEQKRVFERFYRGDEAHSTRGFGLGLPIAQRVVELHGGQIEVSSTPGAGSEFQIVLPAHPPQQVG